MINEMTNLPDWFGPLCAEIEAELQRLHEGGHDRRPALEAEAAGLRSMIEGWMQSMGKPDLAALVRKDIEARYADAKARLQQFEAELAGRDDQAERRRQLYDTRMALERLGRLADVLAGGNVTLGNLELGRHIDRIDAFADGSVVMRTSKLGIFEGAVALLARADVPTPLARASTTRPVRQRRRLVSGSNRKTPAPPVSSTTISPASTPGGSRGLKARWFWEDRLDTPKPSFWAADNAFSVARVRRENPTWTMDKLCKHFGKTPPTIRKALKIAAEREPGGTAASVGKDNAAPSIPDPDGADTQQ